MHYLLYQVVLLFQGVPGLPFLLQGKTQFVCTHFELTRGEMIQKHRQLGLGFHRNKDAWFR